MLSIERIRKRVLFLMLIIASITFMISVARSSYSTFYQWSISPVEHCSERYLTTLNGTLIPFYKPRMKKKTLSERLKNCGYNGGSKLVCPNVKSEGETVVRQMQLSYGRLLRIFHLMSEKHGFQYWLWGGALIGSKRNEKFIAWDEDGDVNMLRKDYEIFINKASADFPSDISLQRNGTDKEFSKQKYILIPAKIRDLSTCYLYCTHFKCRHNDGYQIDIRVFDEIKTGTISNIYKVLTFQLNDIFPLKETMLEGYQFMSANRDDYLLSKHYGNYFALPEAKKQYTYFIGTPWYSCEDVSRFNKTYQKYLLSTTIMGNCLRRTG